MNNPDGDPRVPQALTLIASCGSLLSRAERILRTTRPRDVPYLSELLLRLQQANHYLAMGWTRALANVPEQPPEPPAAPAAVQPKPETPTQTDWDAPPHPLAQRMLNEALPPQRLEWRTR